MSYLGDFKEDATIYIPPFTTNDGSGGAVAPSSAFETADVAIFKNGSETEKTTVNGLLMTSPFNATTGLHALAIDTSNDTGDIGFWVAGADYAVVLTPDETVDTQTVVREIASFSIENRFDYWNDGVIEGTLTPRQSIGYILAGLAGDIDVTGLEISDTTGGVTRITIVANGVGRTLTLDPAGLS